MSWHIVVSFQVNLPRDNYATFCCHRKLPAEQLIRVLAVYSSELFAPHIVLAEFVELLCGSGAKFERSVRPVGAEKYLVRRSKVKQTVELSFAGRNSHI